MNLLTTQKGLPGMGVDEKKLTRAKRLDLFLRQRGWTYTEDLARVMGVDGKDKVQKSYPGKCLRNCVEPLQMKHWRALVAFGIPAELLPEPKPETRPGRAARPKGVGENYCAF